jgi:hypothetical protein
VQPDTVFQQFSSAGVVPGKKGEAQTSERCLNDVVAPFSRLAIRKDLPVKSKNLIAFNLITRKAGSNCQGYADAFTDSGIAAGEGGVGNEIVTLGSLV